MPSTLYLTDTANTNTENFTTTGSVTSWTVPANVFNITLTMTGGAGHGGAQGGQVIGTVEVVPGTTYYWYLGAKGASSHAGGILSWFSTQNTFDTAHVLFVAGAGGGSGTVGGGGAGGGTTADGGSNGSYDGGTQAYGGGGGTPTTGGAAGQGQGQYFVGGAGSAGAGGGGGGGTEPGGSGGGGYYGGGGGAGVNDCYAGGAGGGGGSSFITANAWNTTNTKGYNAGAGTLSIQYYYSGIHDTQSESESTNASMSLSTGVIFDFDSISEVISVFEENFAEGGVNATANISNYAWLSSSLLSAQQSNAIRPMVKAFIIDDNILPQTTITANSIGNPSQAVSAPDGSIIAIGKDSSNNLSLWKITDGTQASQWNAASPTKVLVASGAWNSNLNCSVAVSGYINGTYTIDFSFFKNASTPYDLYWSRSIDGGSTFSAPVTISPTISSSSNYCSVGQPLYVDSSHTTGIVFFLNSQGGRPGISYSYYDGSSWTQNIFFSNQYFNTSTTTGEWNINSLSNAYNTIDGIYRIVFSGYHYIFENTTMNSLFLVEFQKITLSTATDIQSVAYPILTSLAPATSQMGGTNITTWDIPQLNVDLNGTLWVTFRGTTASGIEEDGSFISSYNFYSSYSTDWKRFTYPTPFVFSDGTVFPTSATSLQTSYVNQGLNYYLAGNANVWQWNQHQVVADVSDDVLSYQIQEQASGPSSVSLDIGNSPPNGKWYGSSPTQTGYSAIAQNNKIIIYQGLYTGVSTNNGFEYVPRDTYYVDSIVQNIKSNTNDLTVSGRDFYKLLKTTVSRWQYSWSALDYVVDTFNTGLNSWNQVSGFWSTTTLNNNNVSTSSPYGWFAQAAHPTANDSVLSLANVDLKSYGSWMQVAMTLPQPGSTGDYMAVYPLFVDLNNFVRVKVYSNGSSWDVTIEKYVQGARIDNVSVLSGYNFGAARYIYVGWRMYSYSLFDLYLTENQLTDAQLGAINLGGLASWNIVKVGYNISGLTSYLNSVSTVALGAYVAAQNVTIPQFANFKFMQLKPNNSIKDVVKNVGTLTGITNYKVQDLFDEYMFNTSSTWTGSFTNQNRILNVPANSLALYNQTTLQNGSIEFDAKFTKVGSPTSSGFNLIFRSQSSSSDTTSYYATIRDTVISGNNFLNAEFNFNNAFFSTYNVLPMATTGTNTANNSNPLNIDVTKWHHYKLTLNGSQWMFLEIDGNMVLAWYDNNNDSTYPTSPITTGGYVGFRTFANTTLQVKNLTSNLFYQQVQSFSINPGDDPEDNIDNARIIHGYYFSDLFGRFVLKLLSPSDPSTYTYNNLITKWGTQNSDIEWVNTVVVVGANGITATATDNVSLGSTFATRNSVVVDYTITTYVQAQQRASQVLIQAKQQRIQSNPIQTNNLGAQLLDVSTFINTDANQNGALRVYSQTISYGANGNTDEISLGLGQVLSS